MFLLPTSRPALMGVLNVTPDSFSDGGHFLDPKAAIGHGLIMAEDGADLIDVGGESTRPGAAEVPAAEELRRVMLVVEGLCKAGVAVSIDTRKPEVARQALAVGSCIVNDVGGLRLPEMRRVCAEAGCTVCVMHMKGEPGTMQSNPEYGDVVQEVSEWLLGQADLAIEEGIARDRIWLDPGIGFGKSPEHNMMLLQGLGNLVEMGFPVLVGVSRKSFIGKVLGSEDRPLPANERLEGTLAFQAWAQVQGVRIIRAHDVKESRRVIDCLAALSAKPESVG